MRHVNGAIIGRRQGKIDGPAIDRRVSISKMMSFLMDKDTSAFFRSPSGIYGRSGMLFKMSLDVNNWPTLEIKQKIMNDPDKIKVIWEKEWL